MTTTTDPETGLPIHTLRVEPVNSESFARFGEVMGNAGDFSRLPIDIYGDRIDVARGSIFESDQPVEFLVNIMRLRPFRARFLERHVEITQTFIPLGGAPLVLVCAPPDAREENGLPALDEIRAFSIPGDTAVNTKRGCWHELPFPVADNSWSIITSHRSLTAGLESNLTDVGGRQEIYKLDVEKRNVAERGGFHLEFSF
jgi:ureidoglycolate lyase